APPGSEDTAIAHVVGARPNFVKAAPVVSALRGLVIPHIARALVGGDVRRLLACAALLGPLLLLISDVVGRLVARPGELQVGVVTALVGAPFFIWLTRRTKERGL
ncbi:iron chelate uptake ABC transporter family permease subunit, partial [Nocardiopsis alba]|uniref:iron chelate uptake ABC transporter family permease subunit n=1 Tax=Nocardiopsis alba TaxID=53437 RepID=UPI0033FAF38A